MTVPVSLGDYWVRSQRHPGVDAAGLRQRALAAVNAVKPVEQEGVRLSNGAPGYADGRRREGGMMNEGLKNSLLELLCEVEAISSDVRVSVEGMVREGLGKPISAEEVRPLLTRIVEVLRAGAAGRGDTETVKALDRDAESLVARIARDRNPSSSRSVATDAGGSRHGAVVSRSS